MLYAQRAQNSTPLHVTERAPSLLTTPMHKQATLVLAEPVRKQAVASLRAYSAEHFDDELSDLQATLLLDHVLSDLGPAIYNQAAADARAYVEERAADLEAALHKAEFPVSGRRKR